jgi:hypothetical protein
MLPVAARQIEAHLAKLAQEGRASQAGDEWSPA